MTASMPFCDFLVTFKVFEGPEFDKLYLSDEQRKLILSSVRTTNQNCEQAGYKSVSQTQCRVIKVKQKL